MDTDLFRRGYLPVLAGAFCISFSAFFVKGADMDPSAIAFYRLFFGAAALFPLARILKQGLRPSREAVFFIVLAGLMFSGDVIAWHKSILYVGPGIATILSNFEVIVLAVVGVLFLGETMNWPQRLSIPLALLGLALLLGLHESGLPEDGTRGVALGFVSATFYAFYVLFIRKSLSVAGGLQPVANIAWVSASGAATVCAYCLASGSPLAIPDLRAGVTVAGLGICCQALGWLLISTGLRHVPPFRAGLLLLLQPALSFVWDMLVYGTATSGVNILGAAMAIAAIAMGLYPSRS